MIEQTLHYGDRRIRYSVAFSRESGRKLAIHLQPDGRVIAQAPTGTPLAEVKRAIAKRGRWLAIHLSALEQRRGAVLPREYVSGESHLYLGRRHLLKVRVCRDQAPAVSLRHGRFEVIVPGRDRAIVESLLRGWYRDRARIVFGEMIPPLSRQLRGLDSGPAWRLVAMKRRWGSCSPNGVLSLNPDLVKAPRSCIEYVLLHELCHLKTHNHSSRFYALLTRHLPGWKATKRRLDGMADQLLGD